MIDPAGADELSASIAALYRAPLEEFVNRRAALAKDLRAAKQREAADRVKALRKPSRMAWVLDSVVHEDPAALARLDAALQQAQSGADLRTALETVKSAVRDLAAIGARVAVRAGQPVEPSAVITAMYAVIGDAGALESLRSGLLVDVPDAGGLDMLVATVREQSPMSTPPSRATSLEAAKAESTSDSVTGDGEAEKEVEAARLAAQDAEAARQRAELAKAAQAELRRAAAALAEISERARHAENAVRDAQKQLDTAEQALLKAQTEARVRRTALERAHNDASAAAAALKDAEQSVTQARANVGL